MCHLIDRELRLFSSFGRFRGSLRLVVCLARCRGSRGGSSSLGQPLLAELAQIDEHGSGLWVLSAGLI